MEWAGSESYLQETDGMFTAKSDDKSGSSAIEFAITDAGVNVSNVIRNI
jgi:hypothetical protein